MELQRLLRISTLVGFIIKVMQKRDKPLRELYGISAHVDLLSFKFLKSCRAVRAAALPGIGLEEEK